MSSNEYMRKYMLKRFHDRMNYARNFLGNKCCKCGSDKDLEIDHIDPTTKSFVVGGKFWNIKEEEFQKELEKCQLLCQICHNLKTLAEKNMKPAKGTHGTLSSYKYCRCELCRKANSDYLKEYRVRHKPS